MSILVLTSDTLIGTPATGNLEYNGQFYGTDSALSRAQIQRITQGTAVASTSGTSIDFTSLPAWVKRVTLNFVGVSTSGTSNIIVQIGTGGTPTTSGYSAVGFGSIGSGIGTTTFTAGFGFRDATSAAYTMSGNATITNQTGNTWCFGATMGVSSSNGIAIGGGSVALSGVLNFVRITTVGGTDTFDAGSINILYEG